MNALEMAGKARGKPVEVMFHSNQSLYKQAVPAVTVALQDQTGYESTWKLLG